MKKTAKKKTIKQTATGSGTRYAARAITVLKREHTADPKSKRGKALKILLASKTTDAALPQLKKIGINTSIIPFAVRAGLIKLGSVAPQPKAQAAAT